MQLAAAHADAAQAGAEADALRGQLRSTEEQVHIWFPHLVCLSAEADRCISSHQMPLSNVAKCCQLDNQLTG
jgi:hypothetical protein